MPLNRVEDGSGLAETVSAVQRAGLMRFATAAQRTQQLPTPTAGQVTYRADAGLWEAWTGSAWLPLATGAGLPAGGAVGDFLVKTAAADYAVGWSSTLAKIATAQAAGWYSFRAHRSTALSVPAASGELTIIFNTEDYDHASAYNPATGVYTVPVAGVYQVAACVSFSPVSTGSDFVEISARVGSAWRMQGGGEYGNTNQGFSLPLAGDLKLAAGDQLSILAGHYAGASALALAIGAPQKCWFAAHLVYPT